MDACLTQWWRVTAQTERRLELYPQRWVAAAKSRSGSSESSRHCLSGGANQKRERLVASTVTTLYRNYRNYTTRGGENVPPPQPAHGVLVLLYNKLFGTAKVQQNYA